LCKARKELAWEPKVLCKDLVKIMVDTDMESLDLNPSVKGKIF